MATRKGTKPVGRPRQEPEPGERVQLSFRVTPDLKRRLDHAADQGGRSQSQEAEIRIARSFDREDLLPQVMTLACGSREVGGVATMIALTLAALGARYGYPLAYAHSPDESRLAEWQRSGGTWLDNPRAYDQVVEAVVTLLNAFHPEGAQPIQVLGLRPGHWGVSLAEAMIRLIRGDAEGGELLPVDTIRSLLGPLTARLTRAAVGLPADERGPLILTSTGAILSIADAVLTEINSSPRFPSREKVGEVVMGQMEALSRMQRATLKQKGTLVADDASETELRPVLYANEVTSVSIADAILEKIKSSPQFPTREEIAEVVVSQIERMAHNSAERLHAGLDRHGSSGKAHKP